jgi:hypothetical protein
MDNPLISKFLKLVHVQESAGRIIVLTALLNCRKRQRYRHLGVSGILARPFDIAHLLNWLDCLPRCFPCNGQPRVLPGKCEFGGAVQCWGPLACKKSTLANPRRPLPLSVLL